MSKRNTALTPYPAGCHALVLTGGRDLGFRTAWTIPYRQSWPWQARPGQGNSLEALLNHAKGHVLPMTTD